MKLRICLAGFLLAVYGHPAWAQQRPKPAAVLNRARSLTIATEPNAIIWLDEIRRGTTDQTGKLVLLKVSPGRHVLRIRAMGFKEVTTPVQGFQRGEIKERLVRSTDEAELAFQQAETAREQAKDDESRQKSVELYRHALQL